MATLRIYRTISPNSQPHKETLKTAISQSTRKSATRIRTNIVGIKSTCGWMFGNYQAFVIPAAARYRFNSAEGRATAALINCSLRNSWLATLISRVQLKSCCLSRSPTCKCKYANMTSTSLTGSTRKKTDVRSLSLVVCTACSLRGHIVLYSYGWLSHANSLCNGRPRGASHMCTSGYSQVGYNSINSSCT